MGEGRWALGPGGGGHEAAATATPPHEPMLAPSDAGLSVLFIIAPSLGSDPTDRHRCYPRFTDKKTGVENLAAR